MNEDRPMIWETELPLFGRNMLRQWTFAMLATAAVTLLILGTVFAAQGEWDAVAPVTGMVLAVVAGLWLLGLAIMAALFRGRYRVRYTLSGDGIVCESLEVVAARANRLAVILGALSGRPGLTGAGMIAAARETERVRWSGSFTAVHDPDRRLVVLRNRWRSLMLVQCAAENYAAVSARIAQHMTEHGTADRVAPRSPLGFYLVHSALVALSSGVLVALAGEHDVSLLVPILVLCFALATLWLINLFGYVVLVVVAVEAIAVAVGLLSTTQSLLFPGRSYRGYEVLDGAETGALLLGAVAVAYFVWLSLRAVRGRFLALLLRDYGDMGDD